MRSSFSLLKVNIRNTKQCLHEIIIGRKKLLTILSKERVEFDKLAGDVQICKITGGVAGTVGTGLVIGGFVAAFFTFGISLIVSGVGAGIGASGAIVASGASIADSVISKKKRKLINDFLEEDAKLIKRFESLCEDLKISLYVLNIAKTVALTVKTIVTNAIRFARVADVAVDASRTAFGVLRGTAKGFAIAGVVFSVISLPFDIHMVVTNSIAKHKGDKHKISEELQTFEENIQEELVSMEDMMAEFEIAERKINVL
ncbi:hypothetical protein LOTGIDRAFT_233892 [Lottia gigantea]|uniref:Uncharacterized protein n=1 Tax=Lottia gigantea TaxID=225164 RepID=V4A4Z8_LOTGI|nr:hypothetical protein LOTGIDRAFT_233892 [Lottia gigantea]ESO90075.1 hypothetical protein LOTGIDRAFT_233892 [Lottia gigantea]